MTTAPPAAPNQPVDRRPEVLARCQNALPAWRGLGLDDFDFADPKGFSSFTMGVRCRSPRTPQAALYRHLEGKDNAMLDAADERRIYTFLADAGVAAPLHTYQVRYRIEAFYEGRTLTRHDIIQPDGAAHALLGAIGGQLARFHQLRPAVPAEPFFDRLHRRWGAIGRRTLVDKRAEFPAHEQEMCAQLMPLLSPAMLDRVQRLMPEGELSFSHNDIHHGNIMLLNPQPAAGPGRDVERSAPPQLRLLDFEFSCLNHRAFDFANLFSETVMRHGLADYPHFTVAEPEYSRDDIAAVVEGYVAAGGQGQVDALVDDTLRMIPLSDFMYAMAALPLALEPIQKVRFIPYALTRFKRFLAATD